MSQTPRRGFLKAAGAGAAPAGAAAVTAQSLGKSPSADAAAAAPVTLPAGAEGALAAYVTDVHAGEVTVMVEGREVVVRDHELVARLSRVVHGRGSAATS